MKLSAIKNLRTTIKNIFQNCKNRNSVKPFLLQDIDLKKVALEKIYQEDVFQKQNYLKVLSDEVENNDHKKTMAAIYLNAKPMNKETYAKISSEGLQTIRSMLSPYMIEEAEILVTISKIIKMLFDNKYGESQYTFVSIGRSLSALANCLRFMGVETKQIPLSGCGGRARKVKDTVNTIINQEGFKQYKEFLEKTLKPEENKKRVFCDYADTGKTLKIFNALLNHSKVKLGTKSDDYVKINEFLTETLKNENIEYLQIVQRFNKMLKVQRFDEYAEVKVLGFRNLKKLYSVLNPPDVIQNKLMRFCILDLFKTSKYMD